MQTKRHAPDEGVVAAAHVLQIDDEHVDIRQLGRARRQRIEGVSVEARDGNTRARIAIACDADHVLRFAANAVLGPEQPSHLHACRGQRIDEVDHVAIDAGRMAQHPYATTAQNTKFLCQQNVEASLNHDRPSLDEAVGEVELSAASAGKALAPMPFS